MMLLTQRMAAERAAADGGPGAAADGDGGAALEVAAGLDFILSLSRAVDRNTAALRAAAGPRIPWEACHPVPLNPITVAAATGTTSDERWEPREGFAWHIVRVAVLSSTATAAAMFRDSPAMPTQVQAFTMVAGAFATPYEPRGLILLPTERLVWTATGGACVVSGDAIEVAIPWLPAYLI